MTGSTIAAAKWIVDAHVHFYPRFNLADWVGWLSRNLASCGRADVYAALFAERRDCHAFAELAAGRLRADGVTVEPVSGAGGVALKIERNGSDPVWLMPGRQLVTAEGIEMLAWLTDAEIPERLPAEETVSAICGAGGIPVVNWAPGKWWFRRGAIIGRLLERASPGTLFLCDTALRPNLWPEPVLMRSGSGRGFAVFAGTDPLPLRGEERQAGRYATGMTGEFTVADPFGSMRRLLTGGATSPGRAGYRNGVLEAAMRLGRLAASRR